MSQGSCHRAVQRDEPWLRQILAPLRLTGSDLHLCMLLASLHELGIRVGVLQSLKALCKLTSDAVMDSFQRVQS